MTKHRTYNIPPETPVYVHWVDITSSKGWHSISECPKPLLMKQLAFFLYEDAENVLLCEAIPMLLDPGDKQYADPIAVPKGVIRKLKRVRV